MTTRYADIVDLTVPSAALATFTTDEKNSQLDKASEFADGYLSTRFRLPITAWGGDLRNAVAAIATYKLICIRGYNPDAADLAPIRMGFTDAVAWLKDVVAGKATPQGISDATGATNATPPTSSDTFTAQYRPAGLDDNGTVQDAGVYSPSPRRW